MNDKIINDDKSSIFFKSNEYLLNIKKYDRFKIQIVNVIKIINDCVKCENIDENNKIDVNLFIIDNVFID